MWLMMLATVAIGLVAAVKILIALSRGRRNVGLLIIAAVAFGFLIYRVANPFRTAAGDAMLADLRNLFWALKDRVRSLSFDVPSDGHGLALAAAVFGIGSLPSSVGSMEGIFRKPTPKSSGGSCGSSTGSSCGGSCGGGGGCGGGGCGGCGG